MAASSASIDVSVIGSYTWGSTAQMISDVQSWLDQPSSNFGWVIVGNETASRTAKRFDTRENTLPGSRPLLIVTFMTLTGVGDNNNLPISFGLDQNYPNPFNPSTKIGFEITDFGFVSLKVYDLLGREVRTLISKDLQAGRYEMTFDATGLAGGMYLYRLQSGQSVETKRLVLLK